MLIKARTQSGLNYAIDEELFDQLQKSGYLLYHAERHIETSEYCVGFFSLLFFITLSFFSNDILHLGLATAVGCLFGGALSFSLSVIKINLFRGILLFYGILQKFFITLIFVFLFSIFYLNNWALALVFIIVTSIGRILYSLCAGYEKKATLHNRIALHVLKVPNVNV